MSEDAELPAVTDPRTWLLTASERANSDTLIDQQCEGDCAWVDDNLVTPLIDGAAYFADLCAELAATRPGDLVLFKSSNSVGLRHLGDRIALPPQTTEPAEEGSELL